MVRLKHDIDCISEFECDTRRPAMRGDEDHQDVFVLVHDPGHGMHCSGKIRAAGHRQGFKRVAMIDEPD